MLFTENIWNPLKWVFNTVLLETNNKQPGKELQIAFIIENRYLP